MRSDLLRPDQYWIIRERSRWESDGIQRMTDVPFGLRASDNGQGKEHLEPDPREPQIGGSRELAL